MDFVQQYASLRHAADMRLEAMASIVMHFQALEWDYQPTWQSLDVISWTGPDGTGGVVVKVEGRHVLFDHQNVEGHSVYAREVAVNDLNAVCGEVATAVVHLYALFGIDYA